MIGCLDELEVMLDHYDGVAAVDELMQHINKPVYVGDMQAGSRLVEDVHRTPRRTLAELCTELDALSLASREGSSGLTYLDIA